MGYKDGSTLLTDTPTPWTVVGDVLMTTERTALHTEFRWG
jgi:hypothetical protein